ncbi:MAG: VOC family protein [Nitrososphaerota archaeon]|nr:VOC family protein [Nitrososphaerota archaeon]
MTKRHGVRYIVNDVDESVSFYTKLLGFKEVMHPNSDFAMLSLDDLRLILVRPSERGGGGQPLSDGTKQSPGGWNRISIDVEDLDSTMKKLKEVGCTFRNEIVMGVGGKQILLVDPSGNLVELFQYYQTR